MKALSWTIIFPVLLFSCASTGPQKNTFTQKDILDDLERNNQETYHFFINFEHPYFHTASTRLSLYADNKRWAIVFEKSGYANSGYCGQIELEYFGNCLKNFRDYTRNKT